MSNRRRLRRKASRHELRLTPEVRTHIAGFAPTHDGRRYNAYTCNGCGQAYLTEDVDPGVTPMFMRCYATEGCGGQAASNMYPAGPPPERLGDPVLEWYRPASLRGLTDYEREHVQQGGLLHRPGPGASDWVKSAHGQGAGAQ